MTFWIDKHHRRYWKKEIDDDYLRNICNALVDGKGDDLFVDETVIDNVFEEAFNRGLMPVDECKRLRDIAVDAYEKRMRYEEAQLNSRIGW